MVFPVPGLEGLPLCLRLRLPDGGVKGQGELDLVTGGVEKIQRERGLVIHRPGVVDAERIEPFPRFVECSPIGDDNGKMLKNWVAGLRCFTGHLEKGHRRPIFQLEERVDEIARLSGNRIMIVTQRGDIIEAHDLGK